MQILGYVVFGLSLFYLFFWLQFPYDQVRNRLIQSIGEVTVLPLSIGPVKYSFPFHLCIEGINVESNPLLFRIPDLSIHPDLIRLLRGEVRFILRDTGANPRLKGELSLKGDRGQAKIQANKMEIQATSRKELVFPMKLSGEATFQWAVENVEKGRGQVWALLERGEIRGDPKSLPFLLDLVETVRVELQIQEGMLRISRLEFSGKNLRGPGQVLSASPGLPSGR